MQANTPGIDGIGCLRRMAGRKELVELRHVQYFVAVAEKRHFGRAAQRVGVDQSPSSRSIKTLKDLGQDLDVFRDAEAYLS